MKLQKYIYLIYLMLFSLSFAQSTYYISISDGDDKNSGKSISDPLKSIKKINSMDFHPGDKILFKTNDIWKDEELVIKNDGTSSSPIYYSSYGTGNKPIITTKGKLEGFDDPNNWKQVSGYNNIWEMSYKCNKPIDRLWLNGSEAKLAYNYRLFNDVPNGKVLRMGDNGDGTTGINELHHFYNDVANNKFYLYSTTNPAKNYYSIEIPGIVRNGIAILTTVSIESDYIVLDGLDIQGSMYTSIGLSGADYIEINNCNIGKNSNWTGIIGDRGTVKDKTSDYVTISYCTVDSHWEYDYIFYTQRTPYGIVAASGASHWNIKYNLIKDWWMNIYIIARNGPSQYHNIFNNEITAPNNCFSKAAQISAGGTWGTPEETYVNFYNNYIHDIVFGIQISSSQNKFYYNIFENLLLNPSNEHGHDGGFIAHIISDVQSVSPKSNYFINNTYSNILYYAHTFEGKSAKHINNLYINCGQGLSSKLATRTNSSSDVTFYNNCFYLKDATPKTELIYIDQIGSFNINQLNNLNGQYSKIIKGNIQHTGLLQELVNSSNLELPPNSPAINAGIDISSYIPEGFTDRFGNIVNRANPNIGAFAGNNTTEENPSSLIDGSLNVFLEGSYVNGKLNNTLKETSNIPRDHPYGISPWNITSNIKLVNIETRFVDWVLIELRNNLTSTKYSKPAILTEDGIVVNVDGTNFSFSNIESADYYIVISHRNHLAIMSTNKVKITNDQPLNYDFTDSQEKAYGNNVMANLGDGKYGLFAGDSDANGIVNNLDFRSVIKNIFKKGYLQGDLDMDGITNVLDYHKIHKNIFKKSHVPK